MTKEWIPVHQCVMMMSCEVFLVGEFVFQVSRLNAEFRGDLENSKTPKRYGDFG
jgi:hypothetical protein